jgi:MFS family permease
MGSFDNTNLATALPTIGRSLQDVQGLPWLITIYLLAATAGMPLYGKIADIHGRQFALRIAIVLHMAGCLVCALAPSIFVLIIGRAVQGAGGAGLSSISMVILGDAASPKERGRYYAYFAIVYTTAGACGPALGGFIAEHLHWSVIFWLIFVLDALALAATGSLLRILPRYERPHRLDVAGAVLITAAAMAFMLALNLGGKSYPWLSLPIAALFSAAFGLGALFVRRLVTAPEPLIPIAILRNAVVRWCVATNTFGWGSMIALNVFLPIYLQSVIGLSPTQAGLSLMVLMISLNSSAGFAGPLLGRVVHYKRLPLACLLVSIAALAVLALWADRMSPLTFQVLLFLIGAGFGPTPSMAMVAMQNAVAQYQLGIAVGTMNFSRNLFTTIQIACLGAIVLTDTAAIEPGTGSEFGGALSPLAADAAAAFQVVFFTIAACLLLAFGAAASIEERPLRATVVEPNE